MASVVPSPIFQGLIGFGLWFIMWEMTGRDVTEHQKTNGIAQEPTYTSAIINNLILSLRKKDNNDSKSNCSLKKSSNPENLKANIQDSLCFSKKERATEEWSTKDEGDKYLP